MANRADPPKKSDQTTLTVFFFSISLLLIIGDLWTGPSTLVAILYLVEISLASIYLARSTAYLIAIAAAIEKTYATYSGLPSGEPLVIATWHLLANMAVYPLYCYLFTLGSEIVRFLYPKDNPLLAREHSHFRELREFVFRPYLNKKWGIQKRIRAIAQHYRLTEECVPFLASVHDKAITLAQFELDSETARVIVDQPAWMRREGEIGVSLFYGIDRIYTAMITLSDADGKLVLLVGNLQGDSREKKDLYKRITKAMYGMRPRDFLVHTLTSLGKEIGCTEIWGVSDSAHRSAHPFSQAAKLAIYDQIWLEHGGIKNSKSGFFSIPAYIKRRSDDDIPPQKRSQYRRRYRFLDDLELKIQTVILASGRKREGFET